MLLFRYDRNQHNPEGSEMMKARIQITNDWVYLYGPDNKVIKSERLLGSRIIAIAKLRTFAKTKGYEVS